MVQQTENCFWSGGLQDGVFRGYEPCPEVSAVWSTGIVVFEVWVTPLFDGQPALNPVTSDPMYPTGRWIVLNSESELFEHVPYPEVLKSEGRMFVEADLFELILENAKGVEDSCTQSKPQP